METTSNQAPEPSGMQVGRVAAIVGVVLVAVVVLFLLAQSVAGLVAGGDGWDVTPDQPVEVTIEPGSSASSIYTVMHDALERGKKNNPP